MHNKAYECYTMSDTFMQQMDSGNHTDVYRSILRSACLHVAVVSTCADAVDADMNVCLVDNGEYFDFYKIQLIRAWLMLIDCRDVREVLLETFGDELKAMTDGNQERVQKCVANPRPPHPHEKAALSAFTLSRYRALKNAREYFVNVPTEGQTSSILFKHIVDQLIKHVKCFDPETYALVSCNTIEAAHPSVQLGN